MNDLKIIEKPKHTVLFREGDAGDCAYLVESGLIEISMNDGDKTLFLGSVTPGELLGEMSIIDNQPRSATAMVAEDTRLYVIRRDQIIDRVEQLDPTLRHIFQLMNYRLRDNVKSVGSSCRQLPALEYFVDPEIKQRAVQKLRLEADLWEAIELEQLNIYYQPIVSLNKGEFAGFEALLRWEHPELGMMMPGNFIPLAEETPLIECISALVIEQVVTDYPHLRQLIEEHGCLQQTPFFVAINVSAKQVSGLEQLQYISGIINKANLPGGAIQLEITESQLAEIDPAMRWVDKAKSLGFKVAIDDFGTGYSNLSYLSHLHADTLKIDRTFVRDLFQHQKAESMVRAIVSIAHSFDMDIVAEGIETERQMTLLGQLGCDCGQGFFIGHPMSIDDLTGWLSSNFSLDPRIQSV